MATSPIYGWLEPDNTDLVKNGALAIRTLGNAIDTTMGTMTPKSIVDAKGDLIAASANDTPARLAVGANGETLVADSSTSTGLRYTAGTVQSNPVLNSAMQVWQRGTSLAVTTGGSGKFIADRWQVRADDTAALTFSRQVTGDTTNLPNIQYCLRSQRNSGSAIASYVIVEQSFETVNSIPFAGKTITLSFYARKGANYSGASNALQVRMFSGTGTDQKVSDPYTGEATVINSSATLTSTLQRFTYTGTVASTATELGIQIYYQASGTAGAADYFDLTGVQIDIGSVALPFRTYAGTLQGELAACQRYYYALGGTAANSPLGTAFSGSTTVIYLIAQPTVTMRTTPTIEQTSGTNYFTALSKLFSSWTGIDQASTRYVEIYFSTSGLTAGQSGFGRVSAAGGYLALTAEL
jgi:hypothetical protein